MSLSIHARRAVVGLDLAPGRLQRVGRIHLVHQTVPTTSFDAVLQRRHHAVRPNRSFHPRPVAGFCTSFSPRGHCRCCRLLHSIRPASTFLPTFPRRGFAVRAFRGSSPLRYYAGSASCPALASPTGLSAYPALPSGHPVPNHVVRSDVALPVTSARPTGPGFAIHEQARRYTPPIGFVILRAARSLPAAPHPASRRRSCLPLHVM